MSRSVAVFVASFNTREATELCIRSMRRYADYPFELTVGDSGSADGSLELLEEFEERGWLRLERSPGPRRHAQWLDGWLGSCRADLAVFVDSDVEFLRPGWLRTLVEHAERRGAALVCAEFLAESRDFIEPVGGQRVRLAGRPAPWLLLLEPGRLRPLGVGFDFHADREADVPEGTIAYDVGARLFAELPARGLPWAVMPRRYRRFYRHYRGLSWRARPKEERIVRRRLATARRAEP